MNKNVINAIVHNDLCIGCGTCAGICPAQALQMNFNKYGEYNPSEDAACLTGCRLCLQICPFSDENENEDVLSHAAFSTIDGIRHRPETGYYLDSYVGYSVTGSHRANGASGGMASWMLEKLIAENIVDEVACISPVEDKDKLFQYGFFNDPESIRNCAKSAYYPVEISRLLQEMRKNNKRYAVIGLPCYLKALKLATKRIHNLRGKIIITLGLVCEQTKSKHYTTYLAALAGTNKNLKKVVYRGKSLDQPAYNYYFQYINEDNEEGKLFWHEGVSEAWDNRWFTPNACNYCDDVFAEVADVTFMDAWLPEYSKDGRGTNLIISRSLVIRRLFDEGKNDKQILIETIPIKKVIESQLDGLYNKKKAIAYRLHLANMKGLRVPSKRVLPSQHAVHFVSKKIIAIKSEMQHSSKILFASHNQNDKLDTIAIRTSMSPLVRAIKRWSRLRNILLIPQRAWRRAGRLLIGN